VSEASVYRLLKDHGLITSPAFILIKAADHFAHPTTAPNQLWQTDFTYLMCFHSEQAEMIDDQRHEDVRGSRQIGEGPGHLVDE